VILKIGASVDVMTLWIPIVVALVSGLFSRLLGRRLEELWYRPRLVVDFLSNEGGFRTEGTWREGDKEITEVYIRARVRNIGSRVAKRCRPYLVKLEEVHPSGATPTTFFDSLVLRWPGTDFDPRDIPRGINQFFDVVGVLKNQSGWRFSYRERFSNQAELPNYRGTYRFTIQVTGDGVAPAGRKIDVTYNGDWHNLRAVDAGPA
jgi:hypothetical protein